MGTYSCDLEVRFSRRTVQFQTEVAGTAVGDELRGRTTSVQCVRDACGAVRLHCARAHALCLLPQEEMYIFMEYCDEGTLEEVSRLGLQEHVIRLYSKQIAVAINVLHEHGIVHRDIKGNRGACRPAGPSLGAEPCCGCRSACALSGKPLCLE